MVEERLERRFDVDSNFKKRKRQEKEIKERDGCT